MYKVTKYGSSNDLKSKVCAIHRQVPRGPHLSCFISNIRSGSEELFGETTLPNCPEGFLIDPMLNPPRGTWSGWSAAWEV